MEALLAVATILGGIAALWFFKDKIFPSRDRTATADDLARLESKIAGILKERPLPTNAQPQARSNEPPPTEDAELSLRIASLLSDRQRVLDRLSELAMLKGIAVDGTNVTATLGALHLAGPIDKAIQEVLAFTTALERQSLTDLKFSQWVTDMAESSVAFLDMLINNAKREAT